MERSFRIVGVIDLFTKSNYKHYAINNNGIVVDITLFVVI